MEVQRRSFEEVQTVQVEAEEPVLVAAAWKGRGLQD